jgi:UDP-N-acetylmuramoyl-tripeptide--D-alanyl-D-alanine ligase
VVGVTGSVGKTSVKDLLSAIGAARLTTHASRASFNNELGVPLTLLSAPEDAGLVIVEMGARNVGHIELLCSVASPNIGVVTTVAPVHTEIFGSTEQVARAKGELIESLPADGAAVLNADDPLVAAMAQRCPTQRVITFGRWTGDVRFGEVDTGLDLHPTFTLQTPLGSSRIRLGVAGAHMAANAAAAASAAIAAGLPLEAIVEGLTSPIMSPHRMEILTTESGATVINDSYNANPTSMRAAMTALLAVPAQRRLAVLGVMAELGPREADDHRRITAEMCDAGIEVIAVAAPLYGDGAVHVADIDEAVRVVGDPGRTDAVLVKGSRVAGLDALALRLVAAERPR